MFELLVEQDYESTQSVCPCDHAIIYASSYFPKPLSWQPLLFQTILFIQKQEPRFTLKPSFTKTKYLQNYRDIQSGVIPLFTNLSFVDIYKGISNTFKKTG
jgi:hypothetical protein